MKNLKLFEEFNDHTIRLETRLSSKAYANDTIKEIDVDGFEVTLVTYNPSIAGKTIFTVEVMSNTGSLSMSPNVLVNLKQQKSILKN